jgi:geranylgeranyl pyrophosphate synthase
MAALEINRAFQQQMMKMSSGQHLDLTLTEINLDHYWKIAEGKSGAFFELACWAGARLAGEDNHHLDSYKQYGKHLGLLLQLLDDLRDIRPPAGGHPLPETGELLHSFAMAYAMTVFPEAQRAGLMDSLANSTQDPEAAQRVLETLQNSGVDLFLLTEIETHRRLSLQALENAHPVSPYRETLLSMLPDLRSK